MTQADARRRLGVLAKFLGDPQLVAGLRRDARRSPAVAATLGDVPADKGSTSVGEQVLRTGETRVRSKKEL
jgi:hypothetical protein